MAAQQPKGALHRLLERAHSPDTANHIFTEKIQHRELFVRPTTPDRDVIVAPSAPGDNAGSSSTATTTTSAGAASLAAAAASAAAAETAALGAMGHNGRDARRRARRLKQEQRVHHAKKLKPKPLSARERKSLKLYDVPMGGRNRAGKAGETSAGPAKPSPSQTYSTFLPLHQLWLGYIREILSPQELRMGGAAAAAKLVAADFHGAQVEVTRSACVSRVGTRGIIVRDTRFVFEIVTPANKVKMIPKEGTFFRVEIPEQAAEDGQAPAGAAAPQPADARPKMVFEVVGSQFMHRAIDRANRKFKQHFNKEL